MRINRKGANRIASGHPWIFSSDVLDRGEAEPGEAVLVVDPKNTALGTAHYSSASQISLRMLSDRKESIDRAFFLRRIAQAEAYRKRVVAESEAYRLVHGEGDQLPGLVIDRYGDYFTVQTLDQGMDRAKARDHKLFGGALCAAWHRGAERRCGSETRSIAARIQCGGG